MGKYRDDAGQLERLIEADRVHRDVYTDPEVFQLEMERLWSRTWVYAGHASQIPDAGDFITLDIAAKPVIMVRHTDGTIRVLMNRCAHKGTKVVGDLAGNAGKTFRCPYHAWTYRTDGSLINIPLKDGYGGTRLEKANLGLAAGKHAGTQQGFVFGGVAGARVGVCGQVVGAVSLIGKCAHRMPPRQMRV